MENNTWLSRPAGIGLSVRSLLGIPLSLSPCRSCHRLRFQGDSFLQFRMFRNAQDIPVGILEPGDLRASRRSPDAQLVLAHTVVALEVDSGLPQGLDRLSD